MSHGFAKVNAAGEFRRSFTPTNPSWDDFEGEWHTLVPCQRGDLPVLYVLCTKREPHGFLFELNEQEQAFATQLQFAALGFKGYKTEHADFSEWYYIQPVKIGPKT